MKRLLNIAKSGTWSPFLYLNFLLLFLPLSLPLGACSTCTGSASCDRNLLFSLINLSTFQSRQLSKLCAPLNTNSTVMFSFSIPSKLGSSFAVMIQYWSQWSLFDNLAGIVKFSMLRLKTNRLLHLLSPWLISSTHRKGLDMRFWSPIRYMMVLM